MSALAWRKDSPARLGIPLPTGWDPAVDLGVSALAIWDADRADLITQSSGAVSSWKDVIGAYDLVQPTEANKPAYSAISFNGHGVVTFDGTNDELTQASGLSYLPSGAAPSEDWYLIDQTLDGAGAGSRALGAWGNAAAVTRAVVRTAVSGINRARAQAGDGSAVINNTNTIVDFSGRHVVRAITTATEVRMEVDGVAVAADAVVPNTSVSRIRMGASATAAAALFFQGGIAARIITGALTAAQAAQLYAYLYRRLQ